MKECIKMIRLKFGNHKLGEDTAIFNMGTAAHCPSRQLGLCDVINKGITCYAEKAERQYPNTVPAYREAQTTYWRNTPAETILHEIADKIQSRRKQTLYFRYNESGDFYDSEDIKKLSFIAEGLKTLNIITYGYTARSDLDFSNATFLVKGSGTNTWPTGFGTGITKVVTSDLEIPKSTNSETWIKCPGSCKKCDVCKKNIRVNVAFLKH